MRQQGTSNNFERTASVTAMLKNLGWHLLELRYADAHLCLFYKIVYGLVLVPVSDYVKCNLKILGTATQ